MVDDEPDTLSSLRILIDSYLPAATTVTAGSGWKALDLLGKGGIDAVISDYKMPGMDGGQFFRLAKVIAPNVRRILLTAYVKETDSATLLADDVVEKIYSKGMEPWEFVAVVAEILGLPKPASANEDYHPWKVRMGVAAK